MEKEFGNSDCIIEYIVSNPTSSSIELKLIFTPGDPSNPNQKFLPKAGKYCKVKSDSTDLVFSISKQSLEHEWGEFTVEVNYSTYSSQEIKSQLNF